DGREKGQICLKYRTDYGASTRQPLTLGADRCSFPEHGPVAKFASSRSFFSVKKGESGRAAAGKEDHEKETF
ncbi:MAG TPA: hypothetical protein VMH81_39845, partial [Bryobacteraceae bacterium]|nr:hypothetical protein [Bryobacteraceae bacterium]